MTAPTTTTAASGSPLASAATARTIQLAIRNRLMLDATRAWAILDAKRLDQTFPAWLRAMLLITGNYHGQSVTAAAVYYRTARAHAIDTPTPASLIHRAPAPAEQWMTKAFGFSGPGMLTRDQIRPGTALTTTLGTASRIALAGGRDTIIGTVQHDPVAVGYYRVTDGHPCSFCALLASRAALKGRGSLYRSQQSASFQAHNYCGCIAAPMFDREQPLPAVNQQAAQVYRQRGSGDALTAFRKAWDAQQAS